jgi:hypothetical protein
MPRKKSQFTDEDDALLGELGVEVEVKKAAQYTKEEERIMAGFEEIQRFVEEHERLPQHGEDKDIFERLYAVRLDRLNELSSARELLSPLDHQGLLDHKKKDDSAVKAEQMDDDALLEALGVEAEKNSIEELKHVRPSKEIKAAADAARRETCDDFQKFKQLFIQSKEDLDSGTRQVIRCENKSDVKIGDLFIVNGQTAYIAQEGESFIDSFGQKDCRLRVVFDNGTESKMLKRSFQKRLSEDDTARRIITPSDMGPLFSDRVSEEDQASGTIYVLRSLSEEPFISEHRDLVHKIGFTNGSVEKRIADAENQATFLLAGVEVVKTYKLYNLNANKLENLFHKLFGPAKLNIEMLDRFGKPFKPREWFMVPLSVINEVVDRLMNGTLDECVYDPKQAKLVTRS